MGVVQKLVSQNANKDAERQERSTTASGKGRLILAYKIKHAFDIQLRKSSLMSKHHIQEGSYLVNTHQNYQRNQKQQSLRNYHSQEELREM